MWVTDLSVAPTEVALTYGAHLMVVLVGLRQELNDSFDNSEFLSAGEAGADTGSGTRVVVAGGPRSHAGRAAVLLPNTSIVEHLTSLAFEFSV